VGVYGAVVVVRHEQALEMREGPQVAKAPGAVTVGVARYSLQKAGTVVL